MHFQNKTLSSYALFQYISASYDGWPSLFNQKVQAYGACRQGIPFLFWYNMDKPFVTLY